MKNKNFALTFLDLENFEKSIFDLVFPSVKYSRFACVFLLTFFLGEFLFFAEKANAATYYVDSSVVDTNSASAIPDFTSYNHETFTSTGGSDRVFKTIADINAFSSLTSDDQVLFRRGQMWREQLTVPSSGANGHPIIFGAYGNSVDPKPIINGSDIVSSFVNDGFNKWHVAYATWTSPSGVWFDNVLGQKKTSIADLTSNNDFYWEANVLNVYSTTNLSGKVIEVSSPNRSKQVGIYVHDVSYITFSNLTVTKAHSDNGGIYIWSNSAAMTDITIDGCTLSNNFGGYAGGVVIQNQHATFKTTNITLTNNTIYGNGFSGINIAPGVNNITIERNAIYDNSSNPATNGDTYDPSGGINIFGNGIDANNIII